jgi:hypothetical protein
VNQAACGLFMFSRHDGESVESFEARVREAASKLGGGAVSWGENLSIELVDGASAIEREAVSVVGGLPARPLDGADG